MKHGRPSKSEQEKLKEVLLSYYQKGISANMASKTAKINIKTVLKYFNQWDDDLISTNKNYLDEVKIVKKRTIETLDFELISNNDFEKEIEHMKNIAKQSGNFESFEKLSSLKIKIVDQKIKLISAKTNLIMTPTASDIMALEKNVL